MKPEIYLQVDIFAVTVLAILFVNSLSKLIFSRFSKLFRLIIIFTAGALVCDALMWSFNGKAGSSTATVEWTVNLLYFVFTELMSFLWFIYVYGKFYMEDEQNSMRKIAFFSIPLMLGLLLTLLSPALNTIFSIDADNRYVRGDLYFLHYFVLFGYIIAASLLALAKGFKEERKENRKECFAVATFAVLPIIGGLSQLFFIESAFALPFTAMSIMLSYVNLQQQSMDKDSLTGLNNRGSLNRYLSRKCRKAGQIWYLIILDIDDFKNVNDAYGHTEGDKTLIKISNILKKVFGREDCFLARYGGDEFAVVLNGCDEENISDIVERLNAAVESERKRGLHAVTVSGGYTAYDSDRIKGMQQLISAADRQMYAQKNKRKEEKKRQTPLA